MGWSRLMLHVAQAGDANIRTHALGSRCDGASILRTNLTVRRILGTSYFKEVFGDHRQSLFGHRDEMLPFFPLADVIDCLAALIASQVLRCIEQI